MEILQEEKPVANRSWHSLVYLAAGLLLFGWLLNTPGGLLGKADAVGYAVCHRIDLRSFHLGDRQIPLCARCTGMYLGAVLGLAYQWIRSSRKSGFPARGIVLVLGGLVAVFGIDGLNSYLSLFPGLPHLYEPNNVLRLFTGTGMGLVISAALFPAFNQSVWRESEPGPALSGWRDLAALIFLGILIAALVFTENPLLLYPLALISTGGVLLLLGMVYTLVWLMIFKQENRFSSLVQLTVPLTGGATLALLQIALLDLGRFMLTGTWEGFHFG